jgi:hypothetical protein
MRRVQIVEPSAVLSGQTGRYYVLVSPINIPDIWRDRFLTLAREDPTALLFNATMAGSMVAYRPVRGYTTSECETFLQALMDRATEDLS